MTVCNMTYRGGGPRRADCARRDDLRLSEGPPHGAEAADSGSRRCVVASLPSDEGAIYDKEVRSNASEHRAAGDLGHQPRRRGCRSPEGAGPGGQGTTPRQCAMERSTCLHGPEARDTIDRESRLTGSSLARAPMAASKTCATPRPSPKAARSHEASTPGRAGLWPGEEDRPRKKASIAS